MILIRNAEPRDAFSIFKLAKHLNSYNLPADRRAVGALIRDSERSFRGRAPAETRRFLFVAEDTDTRKIAGCSLILACHGTPRLPHLSFEMAKEKKRSVFLRKVVEHITLKLKKDEKGFTEIGGLVVLPSERGRPEKIGKQLSYARFAYMALHPYFFMHRVLVEYLPLLDSRTGSALWKALGEKCTGLSYREADALSAKTKEFILALFPREKIYAAFLGDEASANLGVPGPGAAASLAMLSKIGFRSLNQIDPFDGGPHYGARFDKISLIKQTRTATVQLAFHPRGGRHPGGGTRMRQYLLSAIHAKRVHAVVGEGVKHGSQFLIRPETAAALGLKQGDRIGVTPF